MLVMSNGFLDRNGNAARVAHHGLGLRGDLEQDGVDALSGKLAQLLDEPSFADALSRMAGVYRSYDAPERRAEALRGLGIEPRGLPS